MIILEDKGQKEYQHTMKNQFWKKQGIEVMRVPLPVGDYVMVNEKVMDVIFRKEERGIDLKKMDFIGTYDVCVDTKKDIQELVSDICGKQHSRFRDECILAQNNNIKLYIVVENEPGFADSRKTVFNPLITKLEELNKWNNPRLFLYKNSSEIVGSYQNGRPRYKKVQKYPKATHGEQLQKSCMTMQERYGVVFKFCTPEESGKMILDLLGVVK